MKTMYKKHFKKIFLTVIGVSLILAPLLCCCLSHTWFQPKQEQVAMTSCHQDETASESHENQPEDSDCDCPEIVSLQAQGNSFVVDNEQFQWKDIHMVTAQQKTVRPDELLKVASLSPPHFSVIIPRKYLQFSNLRL
jgi:hypothetical protein